VGVIGSTLNNREVSFRMKDRVLKVFTEVFDLPKGVNTEQLKYNDYVGWDSVAHMTLIAALEVEFDCMLEMDDILAMSSFEKACEIMGKFSVAA
jgi:acyl carrier protein